MSGWNPLDVKMSARRILKESGWNSAGQPRKNYWQAVNLSFVVLLLAVVPNSFLQNLGMDAGLEALLLSIGITLLFLNPLEVGNDCYYLWQKKGKSLAKESIMAAFSGRNYLGLVTGMFFYSAMIFAWGLLLVVPGIIKGYSYRMVPFLLAENPSMNWKRALEISSHATQGEKLDMFLLDISFAGWILLCLITLGLGLFFFMPYYCTAMCEVYTHQRAKALEAGWVLPQELEQQR